MYHKKIKIKIREHHSRTRKPRKTNFGKKKWGPCTPSQCYGAAFWVLRPANLYKYEKKVKRNNLLA